MNGQTEMLLDGPAANVAVNGNGTTPASDIFDSIPEAVEAFCT